MYGAMKQKVALGALGGSSSSILAKSLKWIWTCAPRAISDRTTGREALAFGRGYKHVYGFGDSLFLGAWTSSFQMREETPIGVQSRRFSSYHDLPAEEAFLYKNAVQIGGPHYLLSPPAIELDSSEGQLLWTEAIEEGSSRSLIPMLSCYGSVSEPRLYGLASISNVLNTLETASEKMMKRRWRFPFEFLLDSCDSFEKVRAEGLTLGKLAFLAFCNGAKVKFFPANRCTIDDFRSYIIRCAVSRDDFMVPFFDRGHLKQVGGKHCSPIGAYHAGRDLVLVLEISRFDYPPYWIPLQLLWEAITSTDEATGNQKGFMVLSTLPHDRCIRYTLSCKDENWISSANHLKQIPSLLKSEHVKDIDHLLAVVFASYSMNFGKFITTVTEDNRGKEDWSNLAEVQLERVNLQECILRQLQETELFKQVSKWLDSRNSHCESVTSSGLKCTLPENAGNKERREVEHSNWNPSSSNLSYSTSPAHSLNRNAKMLPTEMSGQGASMVVLSSHSSPSGTGSNEEHLAGPDALTMLLFALPPHTWSGINDAKLSMEFNDLVSIQNVPPLLRNEILCMRQQFQLLTIDLD